MKTTKHLALVGLLVLGASAFSRPALGQTWLFTGSAKLTPAGDEASASGSAKLSGQYQYSEWGWVVNSWGGDVSVSCSRLTPYATYLIVMSSSGGGVGAIDSPDGFADGRGNLTIKSSWWFWGVSPDTLQVYRVEPTGNVLVLSGAISFKYRFVRFH